MGKWDAIDHSQSTNTTDLVPAQNGDGPVSDERSHSLPSLREIERLPAGWAKWQAKREALKVMAEAQMGHLKAVVDAQLRCDKARISVELEKALARNRDELFSFLETLGVQQFERRHKIALQWEEVTKNWFSELVERDMPEFMRQMQVEAVKNLWIKKFTELMKDELGE